MDLNQQLSIPSIIVITELLAVTLYPEDFLQYNQNNRILYWFLFSLVLSPEFLGGYHEGIGAAIHGAQRMSQGRILKTFSEVQSAGQNIHSSSEIYLLHCKKLL